MIFYRTKGVDIIKKRVVAIASSTGGVEAITSILMEMPKEIPPILIVQHMPTGFTKILAKRLDSTCKCEVKEGSDLDAIRENLVLIAPADKHMIASKENEKAIVRCFEGERVNGLMPAADILFESIAKEYGENSVGVILTGMGTDGAKGLLKMKQNGAKTIGQNKETCVIYGMSAHAKKINALDIELPLNMIGKKILELAVI